MCHTKGRTRAPGGSASACQAGLGQLGLRVAGIALAGLVLISLDSRASCSHRPWPFMMGPAQQDDDGDRAQDGAVDHQGDRPARQAAHGDHRQDRGEPWFIDGTADRSRDQSTRIRAGSVVGVI